MSHGEEWQQTDRARGRQLASDQRDYGRVDNKRKADGSDMRVIESKH